MDLGGSRAVVRGARRFTIARGGRAVAGLTGNKNKKKPARGGLNLGRGRALCVYVAVGLYSERNAPIDY